MLESTVGAFKAALIEDTRQKELVYFETAPSTSVELFQTFLSRLRCLSPKTRVEGGK